jgi:hypothetical protein
MHPPFSGPNSEPHQHEKENSNQGSKITSHLVQNTDRRFRSSGNTGRENKAKSSAERYSILRRLETENDYPTSKFPRHYAFFLLRRYVRERVKFWEVKTVRGYEVDFVMSRGGKGAKPLPRLIGTFILTMEC